MTVESLYYLLEPEVAGTVGPNSDLDASVHPPVVKRLEYVFAGWLGDHLVESFPCYLVSEALARRLRAEPWITGYELDKVSVALDPQFVLLDGEVARSLPRWRWLKLVGRPGVDDIWPDGRANLHVSGPVLAVLQDFKLEHCRVTPVRPG